MTTNADPTGFSVGPACDADGPAVAWARAVDAWQRGNPHPLAKLVSALPILDEATELLADLVRGEARRPRGRRPSLMPAEERAVFAAVVGELDRIEAEGAIAKRRAPRDPLQRAFRVVAKARNCSVDKVRGIFEKVQYQGLTRAVWRRWMRPR